MLKPMDELKEAWNRSKEARGAFDRLTKEEIQANVRARSIGVLDKLRKKVYVKFWFCVGIGLAIAVFVPFVYPTASQVLLLVLLVAYVTGAILLYREQKVLGQGVDMAQDIAHGLKAYHKRIKAVIRYEELTGLILYPVSISGGFLYGMQAYDRSLLIMNNPSDWLVLTVSLLVVTPLAHLVTRQMNKLTFGKYLEELEQNIRELDTTI